MSDVIKTEWSIQDVETGDVLISVGGQAENQQRLDVLEAEEPGRFQLVSRVVQYGDWA